MTTTGPDFQRARSADAKQQREVAILDAARRLGAERGIRTVTLTDIAEAVGMHKSALLRYFETREQIFLRLTAQGWREWGPAVRAELELAGEASPSAVAHALAASLASRPVFCDLLAQAPLNLERNVSLESVREFKRVTLDEVDALSEVLQRIRPGLTAEQAIDLIAAATSLSGAYWQMATPGREVEELYRSDPRLAHAVVDVEPRVARTLTAMLEGYSHRASTVNPLPSAAERRRQGT
ncbi:TetR family transcriptional regulator [Herbiconiux sp. CPCC 205763]|uniref:TetR family transcriptional regulator n=1 Tax=Herbiconiux aconitum TaxID=2970913 RepID=A0ABT2GSF1_9MICO|nr:TetR family transcriptional regulator [Herbiconiux aconitum]MCS5719108.1 TetR family transcriptional regulator [Herbiconiux aconitum]